MTEIDNNIAVAMVSGEPRPELTVAICAYNAERRIGMVLESLARQKAPASLRWELLVVDNASTDATSRVTRELCAKHGLPLRLLFEGEPGLAHARRTAALAARAEILSFLDDDNVVDEHWLEACVSFLREHPRAGLVGALVEPLFEDPASRPANFKDRYAGLLSMYDQGPAARQLDIPQDPWPVGAGMTGRTSLIRFLFDDLGSVTVGRKGDSLAGGEDVEAMLMAHKLGWEIWYAPRLRLLHYVPVRKLTDAYWEKWMVDTSACRPWLEVLSGVHRPQSRLGCGCRWLRLEALGLLYWFLARIPSSWNSRVAKAAFWRHFYRSRGAGWKKLFVDYDNVQRVMRAVQTADAAVRPGAATSAEAPR